MQITSAAHLWAQTSLRQDQSLAKSVSGANLDGISTASEPLSTQAAIQSTFCASASVFANFDLTAITPTEIDQLTSDLKKARFDDLGFIMALERDGAAYHAEMDASGGVYNMVDSTFAPDAPVDLIAKTRNAITLASRYGQDTERLSMQLLKLEAAQNTGVSVTAPSGPSTQLAETLVLFQAQRLWIE